MHYVMTIFQLHIDWCMHPPITTVELRLKKLQLRRLSVSPSLGYPLLQGETQQFNRHFKFIACCMNSRSAVKRGSSWDAVSWGATRWLWADFCETKNKYNSAHRLVMWWEAVPALWAFETQCSCYKFLASHSGNMEERVFQAVWLRSKLISQF